MIITFSKHDAPASAVMQAVATVSREQYDGNVLCAITWGRGRRVRFTLATRDAWAYGSRRSASGRHMRKASWEAHRDVLEALFRLDPDATVRTALATYRGARDFADKYPGTAYKNIGSQWRPATMPECSV